MALIESEDYGALALILAILWVGVLAVALYGLPPGKHPGTCTALAARLCPQTDYDSLHACLAERFDHCMAGEE